MSMSLFPPHPSPPAHGGRWLPPAVSARALSLVGKSRPLASSNPPAGYRRNRMVSLESSAALEPFAGMEPIFRSAENDTDGLDVQALAAAVRALPGRCRQVFTLRKLYALTHREIAQRLRLSERAVEQQIERGARHALSCLRPRVASTHELSAVAVRAAAVWLARRDRGLSSEETVDFLDWLRYAANDAAYAELDTAFRAFDRLQALPASTSETPDPNALAGTRPSRLRGGFAWIAAASLAAAAIAVIAVLQN